jgi:Glycogen debranching enzyme
MSYPRVLVRAIVIGVGLFVGSALRAAPAHSLTVGEGAVDPIGFHQAEPRFSWKLPVGVKEQTAYRILVEGDADTWDSGWVNSAQTTFVRYGGEPLLSRARATWRVAFRDERGEESGWSEPATFELGLLSAADWKAKWIRPMTESALNEEPVAWLQKSFSTTKQKIVRARLYVTARGLFEVWLNGERVGCDYFVPGWTAPTRLDTLTYDVTAQLRSGGNRIEARIAKGWYAGKLGWKHEMGNFGTQSELLLQLEISHSDGRVETVVSDETWQATFHGPILASGLYDGEIYDARRVVGEWGPVSANAELGEQRLQPKPFAPVREVERLTPLKITQPVPGRIVFDLGQNMVGWARLKVPVEEDQTITVRFAEMLNADGTLYTANYRKAKSTDTYTAADDGVIEWQPTFTFHGFRYVELSGLPTGAQPVKEWVTGVVLHTDLARTGRFESSLPKLNRLQQNIVWGQRGNFLDIPSDCPQRDERLGWTGDAQVFCATSMFNYDSLGFWKSWLESMRDSQLPDGRIPVTIPAFRLGVPSPGWMDAATFVPWDVYVRTGDVAILAENFEMMEKLVSCYRSQTEEGLLPKIEGYGDWLQPYASDNKGDTAFPLLGLAFYSRSARLVANAARVLNRAEAAERYADEAAATAKRFADYYFDDDGRVRNAKETQTSYVVALAFDLLPPEMRSKAFAHLVRMVEEADFHLRTGFLGTPYIVDVLDRYGRPDLAYRLLTQETYPSWFYSINQGATTMWERWNSYSHDQGFGDAKMNSFNHYAYGAIGQWMYERVAGLAPDPAQPGYKHFFVRPLVNGPLDSARAELETPHGRAVSAWTKRDGRVTMDIVVPPNTTATIQFLDGRAPVTVGAGEHRFEQVAR